MATRTRTEVPTTPSPSIGDSQGGLRASRRTSRATYTARAPRTRTEVPTTPSPSIGDSQGALIAARRRYLLTGGGGSFGGLLVKSAARAPRTRTEVPTTPSPSIGDALIAARRRYLLTEGGGSFGGLLVKSAARAPTTPIKKDRSGYVKSVARTEVPRTEVPRTEVPTTPSPSTGDSQVALMAAMRTSLLTGAAVQGGVRTFRGGGSFGGLLDKSAASLRIGAGSSDMRKEKNQYRKKQTNTLGLNLGNSVGLQV